MSQLQFTLDLIGIKDKNIHLQDPYVSLERKYVGGVLLTHKIIHARLVAPENLPCQICAAPTQ